MVEAARKHPACYGARMTGAGFGGCAVALVKQSEAGAFASDVACAYTTASGRVPALYVTPACEGASEV